MGGRAVSEFAGTQRDTLTSFIKTSGELVKAEQAVARVRALCDEADELGRDVWVAKLRAALDKEEAS
jgi:hypothetical protein